MSTFKENITVEGKNLIARMLSGQAKITFTKVVMGEGYTTESVIKNIRSVVAPKIELEIDSVEKDSSNNVTVTSSFDNTKIESGFFYREKGIYATDGKKEVLFSYGNNGDLAEWIEATQNSTVVEKKIVSIFIFSEAAEIQVEIKSGVYLTVEELEEHNTSESSHHDMRELIKQLQDEIENIDVSWDGITDKPSTFPPSEHGHTASQITGLPTSLPASDVYDWAKQPSKPSYSAGEVGAIPTSASCNKNWNWAGQDGQPSWLWGSNDGTNMYVYNPLNFNVNYANSAGNANTLGGYTLEQIKRMCGGDIVGKQMIVLPSVTIISSALNVFTYSNSKGGMLRISIPPIWVGPRVTIVVDGVTIVTDTDLTLAGFTHTSYYDSVAYQGYTIDIPFSNSVTIQPTYTRSDTKIIAIAYINK